MIQKYYGYVYIWYDTKYKKFIVGSHHGSVEDRYKTSTGGVHVRNIFKYRPSTMKFKVLEYNFEVDSYRYTQLLEQKWLDKRPNIKGNERYYNLTNQAGGGFDREIQLERIKNGTHHFLGGQIQLKSSERRVRDGSHNFMQQSHKNRVRSIALQKVYNKTHHFCESNFNKKPFELQCSDGRMWTFKSKVDCVAFGFTASVIDKLRKGGSFMYIKGSRQSTKIKFKQGDVLYYKPLPIQYLD
jgi:hypothetical protein